MESNTDDLIIIVIIIDSDSSLVLKAWSRYRAHSRPTQQPLNPSPSCPPKYTASSQRSKTTWTPSTELTTQLKMRSRYSPVLKRSLGAALQDGKARWTRRYGTVAETPSLTTPPSPVLDEALNATSLRNTWTKDEIRQIYETPLMKLAYAAVSLFHTLHCYPFLQTSILKLPSRAPSTENSTTLPPSRCARS